MLNAFSPLINVNLRSKLQSDQFFLDCIFRWYFCLWLVVHSEIQANVGRLVHLSEMFLKYGVSHLARLLRSWAQLTDLFFNLSHY